MRHSLLLAGCAPEPLMGYLKALGVFRLVAEQSDPDATLAWSGEAAVLHSTLAADELLAFLLHHYRPTPIVAPWNGGSGFYDGGREPVERIANCGSPRFELYRRTIEAVREFVPASKPKDDQKESLLLRCRSELPDEVVDWLDVCFVLGEDRVSYFPLLGTGGNDGRLDFTNNFMQRLADVLPLEAATEQASTAERTSGLLLRASLFADTLIPVDKSSIGQFNPGGIGGPNGTQGGFEARSRVNPWDFVLMIEGTLLLAGAAARRLGTASSPRAVFPFCVETIGVGYGSATASEETTSGSRAELWLPVWLAPCTLGEVRHVFSEGRAQLGRRQARNSVEFALAASLLGVNRGLTSFVRYGFLKRNGLAFLATPLGRLNVTARPQASLLDDPPVTEWLDRWRRSCADKEKTPARYLAALRQVDRAFFAFANRSEQGNDAGYLLNALIALGHAERTLARGLAFAKDKYLRPLQGLSPQWLTQADDGSPEFRLAASLAGIRGERDSTGSFRTFLEEVAESAFVSWSPGSNSAVWSHRSPSANLAAVFRRRALEAFRAGLNRVPIASPRPARLEDVVAFLNGQVDDQKLASLIWGLACLKWSDVEWTPPARTERPFVPLEFTVLRLLVQPLALVARDDRWTIGDPGEAEATRPSPELFEVIASGRADAILAAVDQAARRLRSGGWSVMGHRNRRAAAHPVRLLSTVHPERLLASLMIPLGRPDLEHLASIALYPPESEE